MSSQDNGRSDDTPAREPKGWRAAYDRTVQLINTILAPAVIIKLIFDLQGMLEFLEEHIVPSLIILTALVLLFVMNLIDFRALKASIAAAGTRVRMRSLRVAGYVLTGVALVALLSVGVAGATSGIHFVIIASAPSQEDADRVVKSINSALKRKEVRGLHARTYASGGNNPWYSIVVGGPHFSKTSANRTLEKARRVMPERVDDGAWIRSYELGVWIRRALGKVLN